ncbi:unnamed protein product, partial [Brenthis ino]
MTSNMKNSFFPKVQYNVPHIRQRFHWDCGVTCVLMLLPEDKRLAFLKNFSQICLEEGFGQSTWTIDLCYLLKRFNIKHCMYTTRQTPHLKCLTNFDKSKIMEAERIAMRFSNAKSLGIIVKNGTLSIQDIISHVYYKGPAIVLVDAALLSCNWCKYNKMSSEIRRIFGGRYRGHYVVVVGWAGALLYRDPARPRALCAAAPARLDAARAVGTDCDVILIYDDYK